MKHCSKCLMPSSRPGIVFDTFGVCSACNWHKKKKNIDWKSREKKFKEIINWAKKYSFRGHNCVLGVSGGKDSYWQAFKLRQLGLNPLLVNYTCSDGTELGKFNLENLIKHNFSLISLQPNPNVAKKLAKKSFLKFGNVAKFSEFSLFTIPLRVAISYKIPLVFFGENPALEAGDLNKNRAGWDAIGIKDNHTLAGANIKIWEDREIKKKDLVLYTFPSDKEIKKWGGRSIFMGYFFNWSGWKNAIFSRQKGMKFHQDSYKNIGNLYKHNSLDTDFTIVNSMLKHIKFGFGHTTEFVSYDIRDKRITRREGAALVKALDGRCAKKYIQRFCDWSHISYDLFNKKKEIFYGEMWNKNKGKWKLKSPVWESYNNLDEIDINQILKRISTDA